MQKFYTEIFFRSAQENDYWFPLFIEAENNGEANKLFLTIKNAINQEHNFQKCTGLINVLTDEYAAHLKEKVRNKLKGKIKMLNVEVWDFTELNNDENLSFDEHLNLIEYNGELTPKTIADKIENHQFPVRLVRRKELNEFNEFLTINVVGLN